MPGHASGSETQTILQGVIGYLNFSEGTFDPRFLGNINELYRRIESDSTADDLPHEIVWEWLRRRLAELSQAGGAFADIRQASTVTEVAFRHVLSAYRQHHRDLLFHQTDRDLWRPYFVCRVFQALLVQGAPWEETERLVEGALTWLNDFIGYRPVAVLETDQKMEPYKHEWVAPIPLYVEGAGVAVGRYEAIVHSALEILHNADGDLLGQAWFDPKLLDELALDPRAYDFDHPAKKRPNHHFGQWDPHTIDNQGRYRRFVVQQVTLDALLSRCDGALDLPQEELQLEAASVLAGTILMASGISGSGPDTHSSTTTFATLLPRIATYRDKFYQHLLSQMQGPHASRLREEAAALKQPFGGARHYLNQQLARLRAWQLQSVHVARLFARMGRYDVALRHAHSVQVTSARMLTQIDCSLTEGHQAIDAMELAQVPEELNAIVHLLKRAIDCGAVVDPWNVVGFGANFSLFPARENSVHDYRADELVDLVEQIFGLCARAWTHAAALGDEPLQLTLRELFHRLSQWWDPFATYTVSGIKRLVGEELEVSTDLVATALRAWRQAGSSSGDIVFWRKFVDRFESPKAFQLTLDALLEKHDYIASMALLMHWLSQAERVPLAEGDSSFHSLVQRWLWEVACDNVDRVRPQHAAGDDPWPIVLKFFDFLEANAQEFWDVPTLNPEAVTPHEGDAEQGVSGVDSDTLDEVEPNTLDELDDADQGLFGAAYEEVIFKDSAADGIEGDLLDDEWSQSDDPLEYHSQRLKPRLALLTTVARLWKQATVAACSTRPLSDTQREALQHWQQKAQSNIQALTELLIAVQRHPIPRLTLGTYESMLQLDRQRNIKEALLERVMATLVATRDVVRLLRAAAPPQGDDASHVDSLVESVLAGDVVRVRQTWRASLDELLGQELLYVPLARGGDPRRIVPARSNQRLIQALLGWLPRLGLIKEACELLKVAQAMETNHPVGATAVSEYDQLFEHGFKTIVQCVIVAANDEDVAESSPSTGRCVADAILVETLQRLTDSHLDFWLSHSKTLRLSVVEKFIEESVWRRFVDFVKRYGKDLFTQQFLNLGNIRAILHQGLDDWLEIVQANPGPIEETDWFRDLDRQLPRAEASDLLTLALETVLENYGEYRDYNTMTTQSDQGELFFGFVDFLRLRCQYDRVAWKLKPLAMVHEVLVRNGRNAAAEIWSQSLASQTSEAADSFRVELDTLTQKYGMCLASVRDRIAERFVRPLTIDRLRALVRPSMPQDAAGDRAFAALQEEIDQLAQEPSGAGLDLPTWLEGLEDEVADCQTLSRKKASSEMDALPKDVQVRVSWEDIERMKTED